MNDAIANWKSLTPEMQAWWNLWIACYRDHITKLEPGTEFIQWPGGKRYIQLS